MRKLAKPTIKKVGTISSGNTPAPHITTSAEPAHSNISTQNMVSVIFSTITQYQPLSKDTSYLNPLRGLSFVY